MPLTVILALITVITVLLTVSLALLTAIAPCSLRSLHCSLRSLCQSLRSPHHSPQSLHCRTMIIAPYCDRYMFTAITMPFTLTVITMPFTMIAAPLSVITPPLQSLHCCTITLFAPLCFYSQCAWCCKGNPLTLRHPAPATPTLAHTKHQYSRTLHCSCTHRHLHMNTSEH